MMGVIVCLLRLRSVLVKGVRVQSADWEAVQRRHQDGAEILRSPAKSGGRTLDQVEVELALRRLRSQSRNPGRHLRICSFTGPTYIKTRFRALDSAYRHGYSSP